jgi:hypothetical protein
MSCLRGDSFMTVAMTVALETGRSLAPSRAGAALSLIAANFGHVSAREDRFGRAFAVDPSTRS